MARGIRRRGEPGGRRAAARNRGIGSERRREARPRHRELLGSATILLGTGTGTFNSLGNSPANGFADMIAAGDVNADGKPDLAISNFFGATNVSVLIGMGSRGLRPAGRAHLGGDLSRRRSHRRRDRRRPPGRIVGIALSRRGPGLCGERGRRLRRGAAFPLGEGTERPGRGDWNGDGRLDAAATSGGPLAVCVLLGKSGARGGFERGGGERRGGGGLGDFNNDGKRDVVAANSTSNDFSLVLGDATGTSARPPTSPPGPPGRDRRRRSERRRQARRRRGELGLRDDHGASGDGHRQLRRAHQLFRGNDSGRARPRRSQQ